MEFKTVSTVGLGYIGLPTAAVFASRKVHVIGVDVNENVVNTINSGQIHIVEPELEGVVSTAVSRGYLRATTAPEPADAFLIAVPTPFRRLKNGDLEPDLSFVESATRAIAPVLKKGDLVVLESTSPVGATELMAGWLAEARDDLSFPQQAGEGADINIAHCPERVLLGHVMRELVENDRIIGGMTTRCAERAVALYRTFVEGECIITTARTAEMAKLTENSFRDVNIAFANELSMICDRLDIDVWGLIRLANRHPRVNILQPGPGVGGHCIAVDPWFIVSQTPDLARLIRTAREVNDDKPVWVIEQVQRAVGETLQAGPDKTAKDITVVCYGLSFKPDIDDLRESPALGIVERLAGIHPGPLKVVEPHIRQLPGRLKVGVELVDYGSAQGDVHVLLVDHRAFAGQDKPEGLLVDTRGFWQ
jgi:UDP-N-acetyl-D-mannosaminuronic acid dehydrogenase